MSNPGEEYERVLPHAQRNRGDIVVRRFVEGMSPPAISEYLARDHCIQADSGAVNADILRATRKRWIRYEAPSDLALVAQLREACRQVGIVDELPAAALVKEGAEAPATGHRGEVLVHVPSFGEGMTCTTAAVKLCAGRIRQWAVFKTRELVRGDPDAGIEPWGFPIRIEKSQGKLLVPEKKGPANKVLDGQSPGLADDAEVLPMVVGIHIGFGAGHTLATVADDLGHEISRNLEDWERDLKALVREETRRKDDEDGNPHGGRLPHNDLVWRRFRVEIRFVFGNLTAGFDPEPQVNPISFLATMLRNDHLARRGSLEVFNAMSFLPLGKRGRTLSDILPLSQVREYWKEQRFDIILATGSSIGDEHSTFRRYYRRDHPDPADPTGAADPDRIAALLERKGVRGDFLSLPITDDGYFNMTDLKRRPGDERDAADAAQLNYRPMTLLDYDELATHVAEGRDLILVLGPCGKCGADKSEITDAVLRQQRRVINHLVIDQATAKALLERARTRP